MDGGANLCITGDITALHRIEDITPFPLSTTTVSTMTTDDDCCTKRGFVSLPLSDGTTYSQPCYFCKNATETIISPDAILACSNSFTRWTQEGQGAPPHIWRALAWYLALQDKYPALDAAVWLQGVARSADGDRISQNADEIRAAKLHTRSLEIKIQELSREIATLKQIVPESERIPAAPEKKEQAETRALANFFLALTFAILGFIVASFFF